MSHKSAKKLRKMYRQQVSGIITKDFVLGAMLKPKPRFIPMFIWKRLFKFFIKI